MSEAAGTPLSQMPTWVDRFAAWMKAHQRAILLAGAAFQVLMLVGLIVLRAMPLMTGQSVLLRVTGARSGGTLLHGMTLEYDFSFARAEDIVGFDPALESGPHWEGRPVYVTLVPEPDGLYYRAGQFSLSPPPSGTKHIRGTITGRGGARRKYATDPLSYNYYVQYGIESYYVQEGEEGEYQRAMRTGRLSAEVSLTADGRAYLKALRIH